MLAGWLQHAKSATLPRNTSAVSQTSNLFDEVDHLTLLDGARAVLVELGKALVKVTVAEACAVCHVRESVHHKSPGLFLVEETRVIIVVLAPNLVDALGDY